MAGAAYIEDGDKIAAALRAAPAQMKRELRKSHLQTAKVAAGWTRGAARAGTPQQRHMAGGIGWASSSTAAVMTVKPTAGAPGALGAFYGAKKFPQFPRWVGASWAPFTAGQGPQPINDALARHEGELNDVFLQGQLDAVARAFPRL